MDKSTTNGIYWLASYPKSGNTWFRIVLANLIKKQEDPLNLNQIHTGMIASARGWMDDALGYSSADLTHDELDQLRPQVYRWYSEHIDAPGYHKIHDAYTYTDKQTPLIPIEGCLGALYFVRNPLDVAISFANHSSCSIDEAIKMMRNEQFAFCKSRRHQVSQLRQWLLSWSLHVNSWINAKAINLLVIRYEDMKSKPFETFTNALNFLQIHPTEAALNTALTNAHIDKLQQQEAESGFCEKPLKVTQFFRKGIVGDWKNTLTEEQVAQIISDHGPTMRAFGYLSADGDPLTGVD